MEDKFIILELELANNDSGEEFIVAELNLVNIENFGFGDRISYRPNSDDDSFIFLFPSYFKNYLIYCAEHEKTITIDTENTEMAELDGVELILINSLCYDENFEKYFKLPTKCKECNLISPRCRKCEYKSCCLECEYLNNCNRSSDNVLDMFFP